MEVVDPGGHRRDRQGRRRLNPIESLEDTIIALSSGAPPAALGIIRVSGALAIEAAAALAGSLPSPRHAALRTLRNADGMLLDRALILVFPGPMSATGEDVVELHCHGGRAVIAAIENTLLDRPGLRTAQPGEFTRRALANGRIDLAEARGLADLLEAETETQRRVATMATEGRVSRAIRGWLDRLSAMAAQIEASIDFAEEGDVEREAAALAAIDRDRRMLAGEIRDVLAAPPVERWRDGFRVVIAGPPNAGKSTLVNLLSARDAAIVSSIAGTTRDRIEVPVRRDGIAYLLIDTAGVHDMAADPVERVGIDLARRSIDTADLVLWVDDTPNDALSIDAIHVFARTDLAGRDQSPVGATAVSREDGQSVERLWQRIADYDRWSWSPAAISLHRDERDACLIALHELETSAAEHEFIAEHVRIASRSLATIIGINATETMLDRLFARFCVGK